MKKLWLITSVLFVLGCSSKNVKKADQNKDKRIEQDSIREAPDHSFDNKKLAEIKAEKAKLKKKKLKK